MLAWLLFGPAFVTLPAWLFDVFARYGYWAVFFGVCLENAGVPIPGETVLLAGAAMAHYGRLSLALVVAAAVAGSILGDNIGFLVGRRGGRALAETHGPLLGLTARRLRRFDTFFQRHGAKTVFFARFITGLRVFGAMLAGASGLPWRRFLFYNATGAVAWAGAVGIAGFLLAESWDTLERWIGRSGVVALVAAIAIVAIGWTRARARRDPTIRSTT
jgi:membrane protein DedA with SNARE-associated domain